MTEQEFFEQNKGKYFYCEGEKVRVVGYNDYSILTGGETGWNYDKNMKQGIRYIDESLINKEDKLWFTHIECLTPIEQPELDLCKILKGCEGIKLYSPIFGDVVLTTVNDALDYPIEVTLSNRGIRSFNNNGLYLNGYNGECMLFPSKENRDWSTFKKPFNKKVLKDGDYVMCGDNVFQPELRQYFKDNKCYASGINNRRSILKADWKYIIPFEDYDPSLSEEELKKLSIV